MNYNDLAKQVSEDLINFPVNNESLTEAFNIICDILYTSAFIYD